MEIVAKVPISMRMDDTILSMLERLQNAKGTVYWQRDRTWLIEHALKQTYEPILAEIEEEEDSPQS